MYASIGEFSASGEIVQLSVEDRRRHFYIAGKSGTGKSTLLFNLITADLASGRGFCLLDPHGDLALSVADTIPDARFNDTVYFDPADPSHSIGYNPLANIEPDSRALVAAQIVASFKHVWAESWGPRLEYILTNSLRLLLDAPQTTLLGLPRLLVDADYRSRLLVHCRDQIVRGFWESEFARYDPRFRNEAIAPVQNKIGQLLGNPFIRNMLGQTKSTIHIPSLMNSGKVLIVNLSKGRLGEEPSHLLGALFASAFAQAAEARAALRENERRDFTLYVDEFQNFATSSFASMLSEARKWRLSLVLANQFLGQLSDPLRQAVLGNAGTLIVFRVSAEDAAPLAAELGIGKILTLTDTPNHHAWIKLSQHGVPSEPRMLSTFPPNFSDQGKLAAVQARTRARFARPRAIVEERCRAFVRL
jgi:hypothetical protein